MSKPAKDKSGFYAGCFLVFMVLTAKCGTTPENNDPYTGLCNRPVATQSC